MRGPRTNRRSVYCGGTDMSFGAVLSMQLQEKARMKAFMSPPFTCPQESFRQGCVKHLSILTMYSYSGISWGKLDFTQGLLK